MAEENAKDEAQSLDRDHVGYLGQAERQQMAGDHDAVAEPRRKGRPQGCPAPFRDKVLAAPVEGIGGQEQDHEHIVDAAEEER